MLLKAMNIVQTVCQLYAFQIYFQMVRLDPILHTMVSKIQMICTPFMMELLCLPCLGQQLVKFLCYILKKVRNTIKINEWVILHLQIVVIMDL